MIYWYIRGRRYCTPLGPENPHETCRGLSQTEATLVVSYHGLPLFGIVLHMEALELHELVVSKLTESLAFARVFPSGPGEILLWSVYEGLNEDWNRRLTGEG